MKILMNYKKDNKELVTYWKAVLVVLAAVMEASEVGVVAVRSVSEAEERDLL